MGRSQRSVCNFEALFNMAGVICSATFSSELNPLCVDDEYVRKEIVEIFMEVYPFKIQFCQGICYQKVSCRNAFVLP